ncbi:MAG: NAD(P)/FAD-dependent oxidoreductase [Coriobacteriia bacterium]|nr:NAD(P)/FAD-dependent oxidoreductase [Coriobacteriia bacterium]
MGKDALVQELVNHFDRWPEKKEGLENCAGGTGRMTQDLFPYDTMFSPIQINQMIVKNRIVMAPMGNIDMCEETGRPNDMMLQYFFARAKGGAGLITTGLVPVTHGIDATVTELGKLSYFPRIDRSRTVYCGWRDLAQGVHAFGAKIFIQLTAGLGRVGNPQCLLTQKKFPGSASFLPNFYIPGVPCMRLSGGKIKKIIKNMGQAAADAHAMGLDGVYLHGHEGYLIEQLTNPAFNHRKIGKYADFKRFGVDMIKEIRKRVGPKYPIMYRIDLSLALEESYDEETLDSTHLKKFKGGRTIAQTLDYMEDLVKAGVDIFDVDLGCYDNWWLPHPPSSMPAGCFLQIARITKKYFKQKKVLSNAGVPVPIVGVGKLGYPDIAEKALRDGDCDMVMLGRPLLADPDWPNKVYAGKVDAVRPCIGCQEGCLNEFVEAGHPQCAVNPRSSFESQMPELPAMAQTKKRIAVVGAGPGGVIAALTAARRGHQVDLYEKSAKIGGRIVAGSTSVIKFDVDNYRQYLERQVLEATKEYGMNYYPNTAASSESLKLKGYDTIVVAMGTKDSVPPVEGIEEAAHVIQAVDLFLNPNKLGEAKKIVVIGGGVVGCEMAQWLAYEHDSAVTVIEMLPHFMDGACTANRTHLLHAMKAKGVRLLNMARLVSIEEGAVVIRRNHDDNVPNPYNTWNPILPENIHNPFAPKIGSDWKNEKYQADLVVLATGGSSDDSLYYAALKDRSAPEIYNIGDSFAPGKIHEAVRSAYRLGVAI